MANGGLPPLVPLEGEWQEYEDRLYELFQQSLIRANHTFLGVRIAYRRHPEAKGKHSAFWHLISEGDTEEDRLPDTQRCERISWPGWIISNAATCDEIIYWNNVRNGVTNIVLLHTAERYAVVLGQRNGYYLLLSAYPVKSRRFQQMIAESAACLSDPRKG